MDKYADDENYRRAVVEQLSGATCPHCDSWNELAPATGGRRVLAMYHRPGCPTREDFGPDSSR